MATFRRFLEEEEGQTLVEYAFIISFIAMVVIIAAAALGHQVRNTFEAGHRPFTS